MKALLFPGQGSQIIGMGQQFFEKYSYVREIFEKADQRLGYKLSKIIFRTTKIRNSTSIITSL